MSSRDADKRPGSNSGQRQSDGDQPSTPRSRFLDVDPADIDRYLSGRPPRKPTGNPTSRRDSDATNRGAGTASQLERLQQSVDRANRTRRSAQNDDFDTEEESTGGTSSSSQTAYAAQSNLRSNRRRSYMEEDPYVTGFEDEEIQDSARAQFEPEEFDAEEEWEESPVRPERPVRPPISRRPARTRPARQRPNLQRPTLPPSIANADIVNDAPALSFVVLSTLGLAAMAIVVANRVGSLDPVIATHVSASGVLEHFASRDTVWQIPLLATMLTLMNIVAAWFVSPLDRFASRFLLATGVTVQFVAWVAVFRILW